MINYIPCALQELSKPKGLVDLMVKGFFVSPANRKKNLMVKEYFVSPTDREMNTPLQHLKLLIVIQTSVHRCEIIQ